VKRRWNVRVSDLLDIDSLLKEQCVDAASDAYCALEVYLRLRQIGKENSREQDVSTLVKDLLLSSNLSFAPHPGSGPGPPPAQNTSTRVGGGGPTPQQRRAYNLWHFEKVDLDDICQRLRSTENPLARSTVMSVSFHSLKI
jgi:hypothetical protein